MSKYVVMQQLAGSKGMKDWLEDTSSDSEMSAMHSGDEEFVQSLAEIGDETAIGQLDGAIEKASRRIARLAMQTAKAQARLSILYVKKRQLKKKMKRVEAMRREEARNRATASPPGTPAAAPSNEPAITPAMPAVGTVIQSAPPSSSMSYTPGQPSSSGASAMTTAPASSAAPPAMESPWAPKAPAMMPQQSAVPPPPMPQAAVVVQSTAVQQSATTTTASAAQQSTTVQSQLPIKVPPPKAAIAKQPPSAEYIVQYQAQQQAGNVVMQQSKATTPQPPPPPRAAIGPMPVQLLTPTKAIAPMQPTVPAAAAAAGPAIERITYVGDTRVQSALPVPGQSSDIRLQSTQQSGNPQLGPIATALLSMPDLRPVNAARLDYTQFTQEQLELPWCLDDNDVNRSEDWATNCSVIVKGIPDSAMPCDIFPALLTINGTLPWNNHEVIAASMPCASHGHAGHKGVAWIRWSTPQFAQQCVAECNSMEIQGRRLSVMISRMPVQVNNRRRHSMPLVGGIFLYQRAWQLCEISAM